MTAAMVLSLSAGMTVTSFADTTEYNGQTTTGDYTISTASQLEALADAVNAGTSYAGSTFTLNNSIDMSDSDWTGIASNATIAGNSGTSSPNVTSGTGFAGTFDGGSKTITIDLTAAKSGIGLFGYIAPGGVVQNLIVNGSVTASGYYDAIGAVAGFNAGIIDKVTNNADVTASGCYNVGGIAGFNDAYYTADAVGVIKNSINNGDVTGTSKTGGIAGENAGLISSCNNSGDISNPGSGRNGAGGIAGRNGNNSTAVETGTIRNCYNTGAISVDDGRWGGGITGFQNSLSSVTNCYNIGTLVAGYSNLNNIVGDNEGTTTNCYGLKDQEEESGTTVDETGILKTRLEMQNISFLDELKGDTVNLWNQDDGSLPFLTYSATETSAGGGSTPVTGTVYLDGTAATNGTGTADSPFNSYESAAAAAGADGTIYIAGTVTFDSSLTYHDSVTIQRADGFDGPLFRINTGSADTYVTLTSMTVDGSGSGTLFDVDSGRLRLRGGVTLQNAATGVDVAAGATVEINKTTINTTTAVSLTSSMSDCILDDFGGTEINGDIYLATDAMITVASVPANVITVACESTTTPIKIATPSGITFTSADALQFEDANYLYYAGLDADGDIAFFS